MSSITEPVLAVSNSGLSIISSEIAEKAEGKNISPSLITSIQKCPASWLAESFVLRRLVPQESDNAGSRGGLFHRVMEHVFAEEPELRTKELIQEKIEITLQEDDFSIFQGNKDALKWLYGAIKNYYAMGGRPEKVRVADYTPPGASESKKGLEIFVKGQIGKAERPTLGFIDRVLVDQHDEDAVVVEDWKTGAKEKVWNPKTKSEEGKPEARQQTLYSMILREEGLKVSGARLVYPVAKKLVPVDIDDPDFNEMVVKEVEQTDQDLTVMLENNNFEFKPNFLCSWCPLRAICPKATAPTFAKARTAALEQPGVDVLAPGFEFR